MATHNAKKAARFEFEFALLMMMAGRDQEAEKAFERLNNILNALPDDLMIELPRAVKAA
jgi:hypothetical protein